MASVRAELAATLDGEGLPEGGEAITRSRSWKALQELYGGEAPETVWVDGEGPRETVDGLIAVLGGAGDDETDLGATEETTRVTRLPDGYRLRQAPGPQNPLGDVKFMFPNEPNVYLHDTPAGNLFQRWDRGFSHGCVRLEEPLTLDPPRLRGEGDAAAGRS